MLDVGGPPVNVELTLRINEPLSPRLTRISVLVSQTGAVKKAQIMV